MFENILLFRWHKIVVDVTMLVFEWIIISDLHGRTNKYIAREKKQNKRIGVRNQKKCINLFNIVNKLNQICAIFRCFCAQNLPVFSHFLDNICMGEGIGPASPHCQGEDIGQCPLHARINDNIVIFGVNSLIFLHIFEMGVVWKTKCIISLHHSWIVLSFIQWTIIRAIRRFSKSFNM